MSQREAIDLGRAIRHLRGCRSQAQIAEQADLDEGTISLYETGRRFPRPARIEQLAKGLGCTRLELEELTWRYRRARLMEAQGRATPDGESGIDSSRPPQAATAVEDTLVRGEALEIFEMAKPALLRCLELLVSAGRR